MEFALEESPNGQGPLNGNGQMLEAHLNPDQFNRFYPELLPAFAHEPTRDRFEIKHISDGVGEGVIALASFIVGEVVFGFAGFLSTEVTQFSLQIGRGRHLHDPYFYGRILHSCDPNCFVDVKKRQFIAIRPIVAGEFVTMDYAQTEDYLFLSFPCSCGSGNCRAGCWAASSGTSLAPPATGAVIEPLAFAPGIQAYSPDRFLRPFSDTIVTRE